MGTSETIEKLTTRAGRAKAEEVIDGLAKKYQNTDSAIFVWTLHSYLADAESTQTRNRMIQIAEGQAGPSVPPRLAQLVREFVTILSGQLDGKDAESREEEKTPQEIVYRRRVKDLEDLGTSVLIEYGQDDDVAEFTTALVAALLKGGREVCLASPPSRATLYRGRLRGLKVIELPTEGETPADDEIQEIPMTNLEYFRPLFARLPKGGAVVFEPLSNLILNIGIEGAYRFVSSSADHLARRGVRFYALMNRDAHEPKEISSFKNLFLDVLDANELKLEPPPEAVMAEEDDGLSETESPAHEAWPPVDEVKLLEKIRELENEKAALQGRLEKVVGERDELERQAGALRQELERAKSEAERSKEEAVAYSERVNLLTEYVRYDFIGHRLSPPWFH